MKRRLAIGALVAAASQDALRTAAMAAGLAKLRQENPEMFDGGRALAAILTTIEEDGR